MEIKGGENKKSGREDTFVECGSEGHIGQENSKHWFGHVCQLKGH